MSRTDRHRPERVQVDDPFEQRWYWFDQGGSWGWRKVPWYRVCNCRTWYCCGSTWRRVENRQRRHQAQRLARNVVKGADWD